MPSPPAILAQGCSSLDIFCSLPVLSSPLIHFYAAMDPTTEELSGMSSLEAICDWAGVDNDLFNRLAASMGGTSTPPRKIALVPHHAWDQALLDLPNTVCAPPTAWSQHLQSGDHWPSVACHASYAASTRMSLRQMASHLQARVPSLPPTNDSNLNSHRLRHQFPSKPS
jgi:hypothetical protein